MNNQVLNTTDPEVFEQDLDRRIATSDTPFSILLVDISEAGKLFLHSGKGLNAEFLRYTAKLLQRVGRTNDSICRVGDHTFMLVLYDVESDIHQQLAAEKVIRLYEAAIHEMEAPFQADIRIGIVQYPEHGDKGRDLAHCARLAVEAAQSSNQSYFRYEADSVSTMAIKWDLQDALAQAIENKMLEMHYQPKVLAKTGEVVGAESLLRWRNGDNGFVPPDVFIPVATDIGKMPELSQFVLTASLRDAAEWPLSAKACSVAVNIDADAFADPDFVNTVSSNLSIWGGAEASLVVEITERALLSESDSNFDKLAALRAINVGIAIDDFGTGYSSLSYFRNIPATELKIDKSFIENMFLSENDRSLVETIVHLAHRFGLTVVAEGVESKQEFDFLKSIDCDVIQGYYVSPPLPHKQYCEWLAKQPIAV